MKQFNYENHAKNLPDSFAKRESSNNYKILLAEKLSVEDLSNASEMAYKTLDIDLDVSGASETEKTLFSKTLDLYGEMLNQPRGIATDEQYRLMLKSKIMQSISGGDFNSVIKAICMTFNCSAFDVVIVETDKPCTVLVEKLPTGTIAKAGLTTAQSMQMIRRLMPAGVNVESFSFDGTFEFCATEADMKADDGATKGFTDTEANMKNEEALGGYLGAVYNDDDSSLLPI